MKPIYLAPLAAIAGAATFSIGGPVIAQDEAASAPTLEEVLAHERRDDDRARDQYRNPAETLAFFQLEPTMTVAEYGPGGGWYTRVLAPYVMPEGEYIAFNQDSDGRSYNTRAQEARSKGWTESFKNALAEAMDIDADEVNAFETDEMPEDVAGTVDRVLIFRSMHGLNIGNTADSVLKAARMMLKDDGLVGVVQHRAPEGASYDDYGARQRGYMRKQDVINIFEANGFELAGESEINANADDPANWERGVWTLPPVLGTGEDDPRRSEYLAIGESDRMTLLFRKAQ
ncbi:class I SAM-dependent methyltransferase [Erythrobacter rubeus]|uniref:Class I SAM-dependent methyltransferase n=1 Tax=Erythrobacter rubeus TaxID=2760803 RepID=A0ABR8KXF9_9SPHN|nr:class I SAM-dependent methyltransferase [Erythrobacter rubeus]MBD2842851.1 class I SAM-dependent methyltransferase [Erythrobacter rubeus]